MKNTTLKNKRDWVIVILVLFLASLLLFQKYTERNHKLVDSTLATIKMDQLPANANIRKVDKDMGLAYSITIIFTAPKEEMEEWLKNSPGITREPTSLPDSGKTRERHGIHHLPPDDSAHIIYDRERDEITIYYLSTP